MKRALPVIVIFICFTLCTTSLWANILLKGQLVTDSNQPVPGTKIAVSGGPVDITDINGNFQIDLSSDFLEGERVIISVIKEGWVINHPLDGEWNLPNIKYQRVHTTRVVIVPFGSMKLWSHARIEKHVAQLADELAKTKKESSQPQPVDFGFYLKEWADRYGFTPEQVKAQFDGWAEEVKDSDNYRTLGLRAFYLKNFPQAADYFTKDAQQWNSRAKKIQDALWQAKKNEYESWKDAGNAYVAAYQFREALKAYQKAEAIATLEQYPRQWGEIRICIGNAQCELGTRVKGEESATLLSEAVSLYRLVLQQYSRQGTPRDCAITQNNLGNALKNQGIHTGGAEGVALLVQAVRAYQKALEIYTKEKILQAWADTQNNLGNALSNQGFRTGGVEGITLLVQAVQAYQKALEVRTKDHLPQDWAMTQNNLGNALVEQGIRTGGAEGEVLLAQAVQAYQKALEIHTREKLPQKWAGSQNNLGTALKNQGIHTGGAEGEALLAQAFQAYQKALEIFTQENSPQYWAQTQNNLAELYEARKNWTTAVHHYRQVYKVYPGYAANKLAFLLHDRL